MSEVDASSVVSHASSVSQLDHYLGTDDSDSDSNNDGNFISNPESPLSVSSDSFHELNTSARHRTASYNMKSMDDLKRKKINYPETKLHDAYLIKPKENRDETNAEQIEGEAMDRLATSYGPVVRSSLLNSSSLPPSTDPDAILRRLRDQHNLRRRSLKSLVDLNYDLDVPEGDSDCDGDGGSYGGYFNESMERGDGDELDNSFDINPKTNSNPKRVNLAKVNASIQEVLRTRTRGSRGGGTLLKAITSCNNTENNFDSPSSVASQVEAEIKRSREAAEQQQEIMEDELQRAKEKEEREEQERNEEEARLKREEEERADLSNWVVYFDESNQHHYYFNPVTEESLWQEDAPEEVVQAVNEKGKNMAQAASMATPPPKPPTSPLPNNNNNNNSTNNNVSPLPLFSPTKLIRNFNESYGINEAAGTLLAKPHDPLAQVANTLQTIVTQFAEFSQTQQSHFEQQRREQQKAALNSTINLSLARPAAGQFEDLEEGEGEGSDMGDITGILSQTTLPQYEQVENELVKEEWIKEAGGVGSGVCSGTQTDYISEFDDSSVSMFVDKVISVSAAVVGVNSSTQVSPGKGRRDGGKKVTMVDAYSGRSPDKTVRITVSPHSGHSGKKKKETGVSTSIYISPLKLSLARKILSKILSSYLRLAFVKWRVTSIPPTGITSAPTAVNPQTAALESSEYAEPVKMNFEGMGLYVPSLMSVDGSPGVRVASPLKSKSSISIGTGTISNSLMPLEYRRALSGLKARYGAGAPVDMKIFGVGGTIEPSFCLAIPPAEKEERVETIVGSMSIKIADLTVNGLINSGDDVRSEIMKGREELRDVTVMKVVEDKALIRLRGVEILLVEVLVEV
ncbi:hypothetical protein TL16_g02195 [Triparma laevis f. inornata]|uniref:WW domain-containing protein n=1 Tax=Triparma laevis f. inornata TaxID=1714386 RepID=A0A9W6ZLB0_9STRA|nr:hypothetical protein TL16_g02195 [Triparma laevis f. inornata]